MGLHWPGSSTSRPSPRGPPAGPGLDGRRGGGRGRAARPAATGYRRSPLLGVVFAAGWTPCIGPILGGIIGLASVSASVGRGAPSCFAYAAGLAIPFILVAIGAPAQPPARLVPHHHAAGLLVTGAMLVVLGFLMITDSVRPPPGAGRLRGVRSIRMSKRLHPVVPETVGPRPPRLRRPRSPPRASVTGCGTC